MQIIKKGWNLKSKIWTYFDPYSVLEMGITLKFTETNFFLIKLDHFYIGVLIFLIEIHSMQD